MAKSDTENEIRFDSVEVLSRTKSQAESRVKLVRSLLEDGEIEKKDLRNIQRLYEEARADVNAGLDRLLVEIEVVGSHGSIDPYEKVAERAAKRVAEFLEASDELILGEDRSGLVTAGLGIVDSMMKAFVDVWKTMRGERSERRALLIQRIESLKWGQFDAIK